MELNLSGKTAVVTGGNHGIGRAICEMFADSGATVISTYYSSAPQPYNNANISDMKLDATDSGQWIQ